VDSKERAAFIEALRNLDGALRAATRARTRRAARSDATTDDDDVVILESRPAAVSESESARLARENALLRQQILDMQYGLTPTPVHGAARLFGTSHPTVPAPQVIEIDPNRLALRLEDVPAGSGPVFRFVVYG